MLRKFEDNCEIIRTVNFLEQKDIKNSVILMTEKSIILTYNQRMYLAADFI